MPSSGRKFTRKSLRSGESNTESDMSEDDLFKQFAGNLARAIESYGTNPDETLLQQQERQFNTLIGLEREFRATLIRGRYGNQVYKAFIKKICDDNGNVLTARPYFRERQEICIGPISQALKRRLVKSLYQYDFNYNFVAFALSARDWPKQGKLVKLGKQIADLRNEMVQMNMPLAISQARIFWQRTTVRTKDLRYAYMDFVQIASDGLISAIDKYVLPFSRNWRAVAIGRMKGNFIEAFSETVVHFYPVDKRKIYRANKLVGRYPSGQVDFEQLAIDVNLVMDEVHQTTPSELANLLAASGSSWMAPDDGRALDEDSYIDRQSAPSDTRPDVRYERAETGRSLRRAVLKLPMIEQKLLRIRGVDIDSV